MAGGAREKGGSYEGGRAGGREGAILIINDSIAVPWPSPGSRRRLFVKCENVLVKCANAFVKCANAIVKCANAFVKCEKNGHRLVVVAGRPGPRAGPGPLPLQPLPRVPADSD